MWKADNEGPGRRFFLVLFLASGFAGLVFEVVSSKLLGLLMGNSIYSITTVVTSFMAGLALGSFLADRICRGRRPLMVYGLLEAAVGLFCLSFPFMLDLAHPILKIAYAHLQDHFYLLSLIRFVIAFGLLLIPTTLMGATLPVLASGLSRRGTSVSETVGLLYAINSLGAVLGSLGSSFVILPALGISTSLKVIALVDLSIALLAFWADRRWQAASTVDQEASTGPATESVPDPVPVGALVAALGLAGFASMVYEIAWTRALILVIGSSTYAFSMILASFIAGISLGSYVASRLERWDVKPQSILVYALGGVSVTGLSTLPLIGQLPIWLVDIMIDFSKQWWLLQAIELGLVMMVVLVPATLMGMCFPLTARLLIQSREGVTQKLGRLYAANTAGNIAGSFSAGALLIPVFGIQWTILAASIVEGATAAILSLVLLPWPLRPRLKAAGAALLIPVLLYQCLPVWDHMVMSSGVFLYAGLYVKGAHRSQADYREAMHRYGRTIFHKEGTSATVSVREHVDGDRGLVINGKTDASSVGDMKTQRLMGHLPMLLHPSPDDALVIGLGSGVTLSSVLAHPTRRVDLVEISPEIVEASRYFVRENRNCLGDPRVHLTITDARNHLALTDRKYDVISSEPTNPWIAGVATLFTQEFFQLLRDHTKPGGVVAHWVQGYSQSAEDFTAVVGTFRSVFPYMTLWKSTRGVDYIMVGSDKPLLPDRQLLARRFDDSRILRDMVEVGVEDATDLLAHFLATPKTLDAFVAGSYLLTDDNLRLEFSAPRNLYRRDKPFYGMAEVTQEDITEYVTFPSEAERQRTRTIVTARRYLADSLGYLQAADIDSAIKALREARRLAPLEKGSVKLVQTVYVGVTTLLEKMGRSDEAAAWLKQIYALHPDDPDLLNEMGNICGLSGNYADAAQYYLKALAKEPDHLGAHKNLALVYYSTGRDQDAIREYEKVIALSPYEAKMLNNLGILYEKVADLEKAKRSYRLALQVDPAFEAPRKNLKDLEART
ncbi:MAG: fused MFS/spermidine synthase [Candidatus Riflebacteria bacterium]|nr:fused MFS/spermidine synthase [Candidatus Riflebacteria bacterium]